MFNCTNNQLNINIALNKTQYSCKIYPLKLIKNSKKH